MSDLNWQKIESIIDRALDLPEDQWHIFIEEQCEDNQRLKEEVILLLESIFDSDGWLEDPGEYKKDFYKEISEDVEALSTDRSLIGKEVGSYTIKKKIGEGGMGSVYLAERTGDEFEHRVAIKIISHGRATNENIRRFKREQRILAGLNHSGIARLLDGGITEDGFPYIIMEYVDGTPVDEYCRIQNCSIDKKIKLFIQILEAVRHAHENLVIHRDLKPGNILVDETGNVKILDFGISKLLEEEDTSLTQTGARMLTPRYAAPEQITRKNITTATDLYALGIVFYELLAGIGPFALDNSSHYEIEQAILKKQPSKPSTHAAGEKVRKKLRGDLDAIALKAIRKEPGLRYRVANQFLDDLHNYRKGLPLSARENTFRYNIFKFINRHKKGISTASLVISMIIGFALFYAYRITQERNQARIEANKAAQVTSFLMDLFEANDPTEALGDTITVRKLLERGVKRAEVLQNQPKVQAQMFDVVGQIYRRLGQYNRARDLLEHAVDLRRKNYGITHLETAASLGHLGLLLCEMGDYRSANSLLRESLQIRQTHWGKNHLSVANTEALLAYALRRQGDYNQAETLYRHSLSIRREQIGANHPRTLESISSLGATLHNQGNYADAEKLFREVLNKRREVLGPSHPDIAMSLNNLAALLMNTGRFKEAESLLKESLLMRKVLFGNSHPKVALSMNNLALVLRDQGKYASAQSLFREALAMRRELLGSQNISTAITLYGLAELKLRVHQPDSALTLYKQILPVFKEHLSEEHSFTVRTRMGIGSAYLAKNNLTQAEQFLQNGYQKILQIHPESSLERALADEDMGTLMLKQDKYALADSFLTRSYRTLQTIEEASSPRQKRILAVLDTLHNKMGD